jgi:23S rRNA pseudouridine1911/1915/1917 synthase
LSARPSPAARDRQGREPTPPLPEVREDIIPVRLRVPSECEGWRLDHFLKYRIQRLSRTKIREIIEEQVRLSDGRRPRPSLGVRSGEVVLIERPAPEEPEVPRDFRVLAEDETFLAIDKPAGLPIHTTAKFWRNTLTALLRERYPDQALQVCHRLDRETSGVMLIARGAASASALKQAFARRKVSKSYLALCHGIPAPPSGVIDRPMKLLDTPTHIVMGVAGDGSPAVTRYEVVRAFARHALLACAPETGRQHQIRVHLADIGHPIVGDKIYRAGEQHFIAYCDGGMTPALLAAFDGLARHALHAHRLTFPHPKTGSAITVESPLPEDLATYIRGLAS